MAFPIRIKLLRKDTNETFKEWAKRTGKTQSVRDSTRYQLMPYVNEEGNVGYVNFEDFYTYNSFMSPKDWKLMVATRKDDKGDWIYEQVGH